MHNIWLKMYKQFWKINFGELIIQWSLTYFFFGGIHELKGVLFFCGEHAETVGCSVCPFWRHLLPFIYSDDL